MSKKDYQLIADCLVANKDLYLAHYEVIVEEFVRRLTAENSLFNADIFRKACGLK